MIYFLSINPVNTRLLKIFIGFHLNLAKKLFFSLKCRSDRKLGSQNFAQTGKKLKHF